MISFMFLIKAKKNQSTNKIALKFHHFYFIFHSKKKRETEIYSRFVGNTEQMSTSGFLIIVY